MKNLIKYISLFIITLSISSFTAVCDVLSDTQKGDEAYFASDYAEAVKWYRLAADQGYAAAQFNLGDMYDNGQGVPEDDVEAVKWYRLAAEQGDSRAQYNLGVMYDNGRGVPEDDTEAVKWYRLSAEQGDYLGQNNLGLMYKEGTGVPQDILMAYMWFNLSAARDFEDAKTNKEIIEKRMTRQQIAEGQRLSREWFNEHQQDE